MRTILAAFGLASCASAAEAQGSFVVFDISDASQRAAVIRTIEAWAASDADAPKLTVTPVDGDTIRVDLPSAGAPQASVVAERFRTPTFTMRLMYPYAYPDGLQPGEVRDGRTVLPDDALDGDLSVVSASSFATGPDLASVRIENDVRQGGPAIHMTFSAEAAARIAEVTTANRNGRVAMTLDGRIILSPHIAMPITGGTVALTWPPAAVDLEAAAARIRRAASYVQVTVAEIGQR